MVRDFFQGTRAGLENLAETFPLLAPIGLTGGAAELHFLDGDGAFLRRVRASFADVVPQHAADVRRLFPAAQDVAVVANAVQDFLQAFSEQLAGSFQSYIPSIHD